MMKYNVQKNHASSFVSLPLRLTSNANLYIPDVAMDLLILLAKCGCTKVRSACVSHFIVVVISCCVAYIHVCGICRTIRHRH